MNLDISLLVVVSIEMSLISKQDVWKRAHSATNKSGKNVRNISNISNSV